MKNVTLENLTKWTSASGVAVEFNIKGNTHTARYKLPILSFPQDGKKFTKLEFSS